MISYLHKIILRKNYLLAILVVFALGLPTRVWAEFLPEWYNLYAGDFLWAMLVYFLISLLFGGEIRRKFAAALLFAFCIEFSQLYQAEWLNELRQIKLVGLVLGFGFKWSDLVAYTLGISLAAFLDWKFLKRAG